MNKAVCVVTFFPFFSFLSKPDTNDQGSLDVISQAATFPLTLQRSNSVCMEGEAFIVY